MLLADPGGSGGGVCRYGGNSSPPGRQGGWAAMGPGDDRDVDVSNAILARNGFNC